MAAVTVTLAPGVQAVSAAVALPSTPGETRLVMLELSGQADVYLVTDAAAVSVEYGTIADEAAATAAAWKVPAAQMAYLGSGLGRVSLSGAAGEEACHVVVVRR